MAAPATLKAARRVMKFAAAHRSGCLNTAPGAYRKFSDAQVEAEESFFSALERDTGIDREMFQKLGGAL